MSADWGWVQLCSVLTLHRQTASPQAFPSEVFEHYSIPAFDECGGPVLESGSQIDSNKTILPARVVLVSKLNPRKTRVLLLEKHSELRRCASTEWIAYVPCPEATPHLPFYKWFFQGRQFKSAMEKVANGSTNSHVRVSPTETLGWMVPNPPLPEQRRIAEILDTLDEAIRATEALIAKLEQVKKGLLHDLLTRGIDDNGELRDPERHPEQFKDSPLGRIPREWDVASIGQRMAVRGGKRLPAGHNYAEASTRLKYLRVTDFFQRNYSFRELIDLRPQTFNALRRYEICDGELYLSIAGSLGYAGVYRSDGLHRTILTENAARLVPATVLEPPFVAYQLNSSPVQRQIEMQKGTGGGVPKLALFRIEQLQLTWPSVEEQRAIVDRCQEVDTRIGIELETSKKLCRLRVGLMDDLLSGRVRVSADSQEVSA